MNITIREENTIACITGDHVQINQINPLSKSKYDFSTVYLTKSEIIELAEKLKNEGKHNDEN